MKEILKGLVSSDQYLITRPLNELATMLSLMTEDNFSLDFSLETILPALLKLVSSNINIEIPLLSVRCFANLLEALPGVIEVFIEYKLHNFLFEKLLNPQFIELAEEVISLVEKLTIEYPKPLLSSGGLLAVLTFVEFFSLPTQQQALSSAANMARAIPNEKNAKSKGCNIFEQFKKSLPLLTNLIQAPDSTVSDLSCLCIFRIFSNYFHDQMKIQLLLSESQNLLTNILKLISNEPKRKIFTSAIKFFCDLCNSNSNVITSLIQSQNGIISIICKAFTLSLKNDDQIQLLNNYITFHLNSNKVHELIRLSDSLLPDNLTNRGVVPSYVFPFLLNIENSSNKNNFMKNKHHKKLKKIIIAKSKLKKNKEKQKEKEIIIEEKKRKKEMEMEMEMEIKKETSNENENKNKKKLFKFLGRFLARSMLDFRVLDLLISKIFYDLVFLQEKPTLWHLSQLSPEIYSVFLDFYKIIEHDSNQKSGSKSGNGKGYQNGKLQLFTIKSPKIEELYLNFTLPGYPEIELKPNGSQIYKNKDNLQEYLSLVLDFFLKSGINNQIQQFRRGFQELLPINSLKIFEFEEFDQMINCTRKEEWTRELLFNSIETGHEYTKHSKIVQDLIQILTDMSIDEKIQFIKFCTGSSS
ncbi:e3 ubiquitin-protein ligase trip12 [Anaeramoeba flamelloides]|uniref:HECT-type E3 ubiquitin transferase n=1 Tax=Anaeramoeba flamelloides TaxID=1746091 RepID=A0AAV7ZMI2_9EUKA|nr:e3 ubiquitin-protein ligase trip12 [Anaeramoeba flamelloides]